MFCGILAAVIAVPLFQAWRNTAPRLPHPDVHRHAWIAVMLWCAACVFVAIAWLLAILLGQLFTLIGIHALQRLLSLEWMICLLTGAAMGGAIGLLRDRMAVPALLQRVVSTVLSVLAPVLAAGLLLFLIALPVTGLTPLWAATRDTTPILLTCITGALILINAVVGDTPAHEPQARILRISAMVLSGAMLPLAVIAALSLGLRIRQHGLTPDRLWALTFIVIACAYALAYAVSLAQGRGGFAAVVRRANLRLAIGLGGATLLLATPLVQFGTLSARDQSARLQRGAVAAVKFDWSAMRFDFGDAGITELKRLAASGRTPDIRSTAAKTLRRISRWQETDGEPLFDESRLTVLPRGTRLPSRLRERLADYNACFGYDPCAALIQPGGREAVIVNDTRVHLWRLEKDGWKAQIERGTRPTTPIGPAVSRGEVEIRTVARRQVFVGDQPVGDPFE